MDFLRKSKKWNYFWGSLIFNFFFWIYSKPVDRQKCIPQSSLGLVRPKFDIFWAQSEKLKGQIFSGLIPPTPTPQKIVTHCIYGMMKFISIIDLT